MRKAVHTPEARTAASSNGKSTNGREQDLRETIADFERLVQDLDQQIKLELQFCGVTDPSHFAYPPFAKAATTRKENLLASIAGLKRQLEQLTQPEQDEEFAEEIPLVSREKDAKQRRGQLERQR
jgi:hypothetical protein